MRLLDLRKFEPPITDNGQTSSRMLEMTVSIFTWVFSDLLVSPHVHPATCTRARRPWPPSGAPPLLPLLPLLRPLCCWLLNKGCWLEADCWFASDPLGSFGHCVLVSHRLSADTSSMTNK